MGKRVIAVLGIVALIVGTVAPVHAQRGGRGGGRGHGGSFHGHGHGFHGRGCCAGAFFGSFALGVALSYPFYAYPYYRYPYYAYPYYPYPPYPAYSYPASTYPAYSSGYATRPPLAQSLEVAPSGPSRSTAVQREIVYPDGRYVLYGDGMTQPWRWVWEPAASAPPAPPAR
jgi:hypothetical protein